MFAFQRRTLRPFSFSMALAASLLLVLQPLAQAEEDLLAPMDTSELGGDSLPTHDPALPPADATAPMNASETPAAETRSAEKPMKKKSGAKNKKKLKAQKKKKQGKKTKKAKNSKKGKSSKQKSKKKNRA